VQRKAARAAFLCTPHRSCEALQALRILEGEFPYGIKDGINCISSDPWRRCAACTSGEVRGVAATATTPLTSRKRLAKRSKAPESSEESPQRPE